MVMGHTGRLGFIILTDSWVGAQPLAL